MSRYFENTPLTEISHYFDDFCSVQPTAKKKVRLPGPHFDVFFRIFRPISKNSKIRKNTSRYFKNTPLTEISHYFDDFCSGQRVGHENVCLPEPNFDVFWEYFGQFSKIQKSEKNTEISLNFDNSRFWQRTAHENVRLPELNFDVF